MNNMLRKLSNNLEFLSHNQRKAILKKVTANHLTDDDVKILARVAKSYEKRVQSYQACYTPNFFKFYNNTSKKIERKGKKCVDIVVKADTMINKTVKKILAKRGDVVCKI